VTFGKPLAERQAIQWPLVELATDVRLLRTFVRKTAKKMDDAGDRVAGLSDEVSMCNFRANRLVCEAADRAMQVHGGVGYTRHKPFEHIYRHHRRYRITEGSEEIQIRNVAGHLFGFTRR
jgi:acyl-CoA dehydrogenase